MRTRMEKKREGIVSLTQTELMLVLTVVTLLLLLVKHADLARVCKSTPEACRTTLSQEASGTSQTETKPLTKSELEQEVTKDLTQAETSSTTNNNSSESSLSLPLSLKLPKEAAKKETPQQQQQQQQQQPQNTALQDENSRLQDENTELRKQNEELRKTLAEASENAAPPPPPIPKTKSIADEVGFVPCWLGTDNLRYYIAFALTYYPESDTFTIKPHPHLQSNAEIVNAALSGDLRVLYDYPKTKINRAAFLDFARKVNTAKNNMYGDDCLLAVTINKKGVDLTITNDFIFTKANFYPTGR